MIVKKLIKYHYLKIKIFTITTITDAYYAQEKRFSKDFEIKYSGEYHDLYVQGNTLLLADVFENFQNICLGLYEYDPVKFLSAPGSFYWYWYLIDGRKRS